MWHVQLHGLLGSDVVVRVAVIGYQGTSGVITCQLDTIWVDFCHRGYYHIVIVYYHSLVLADGGLLNLGVNILITDYDAAAGSGQLNSMSALPRLGEVRHCVHHLTRGQVIRKSQVRRLQVERWRVNDLERHLVKLFLSKLLKVALLEVVLLPVHLVFHWVLGRWNGKVVVDLVNVLRRKRRWNTKVMCLS